MKRLTHELIIFFVPAYHVDLFNNIYNDVENDFRYLATFPTVVTAVEDLFFFLLNLHGIACSSFNTHAFAP